METRKILIAILLVHSVIVDSFGQMKEISGFSVNGPQFIYAGRENLIYIDCQNSTADDTLLLDPDCSGNVTLKPAGEMPYGYYYLTTAKNYCGKVSVMLQDKNYPGFEYDRINFMAIKPVELVPALSGIRGDSINREDILRNPKLLIGSNTDLGFFIMDDSMYSVLSFKVTLTAKSEALHEYSFQSCTFSDSCFDPLGFTYQLNRWPSGGKLLVEYVMLENKMNAQVLQLNPVCYVLK